jgi:hypothetical protein
MNIANAKVPVNWGRPYLARADSLSTPPGNTLLMGYLVPLTMWKEVDMNGCDLAPQAFP